MVERLRNSFSQEYLKKKGGISNLNFKWKKYMDVAFSEC